MVDKYKQINDITVRWSKSQFTWRTRRGTKELDVMFTRFMEKSFDGLDDYQVSQLQRLLTELEEPDLQKWLTNDVKETDTLIHQLKLDKGLSEIVAKVRKDNHC